MLRLVYILLDGMKHQEITALIAIDLSAAFDTVDHDILVDVLINQYSVCGSALELVDSYLRPRSCCVKVNQISSSQRDLTCSVPQGSCLGLCRNSLRHCAPINFRVWICRRPHGERTFLTNNHCRRDCTTRTSRLCYCYK